MSIDALRWAFSVETGSPTTKAVLVVLADFHNATTGAAWPSLATIARCSELSERSVRRALRALETSGLIRADGWTGVRPDRQTIRYRLAIGTQTTGGHTDRPSDPRGDTQSKRADTQSTTGGHPDPRTLTEPLENRADELDIDAALSAIRHARDQLPQPNTAAAGRT